MKKIWKRFLAYTIDMMVVMLIAQSLSGIPFLNKQLDDYKKYYQEYTELVENYQKFKLSFTEAFEDKKLTEKEYQSLIKEYPDYEKKLKEFYEDKKLTEKEYQSLGKEIDSSYQKNYEKVYYQIEKNSITYFIVYLITVFAYFVGFNKITNGQTLGKKLMRLKITNNNQDSSEVSNGNYIIRAIILYQPIYYLVKLIGINTLSMNQYYNITSILYDIQYYLELIIIAMAMIRQDGRGLHDFLAKTRVVLLDKDGKEIEESTIPLSKKKKIIEKPNE